MNIAIININKNTDDVDNNIIEFLSTILSNKRKAKNILDILDEKFNIKPTKNVQKEVGNMCDLGKGLFQQGKAEGEKNKTLQIAKDLMKSQNWTAIQALKAINTPKNEIPQYLALLG